ncbi:PREDICTED: TPR repeat-containing thioredoxin TDX isoform X2 [Tarenaya hassleriana]|uniref:TPR repeat-containing thioredoxin TDX isoform X2 n=1 Tax=Tarenaya hassleriana TaxID=28532 RepID=UPI00053C8D3E|nr:PREDICTED: TPR repeat-containing thioredoxin TDX isoform X2 [Tarenaya hassleriana]
MVLFLLDQWITGFYFSLGLAVCRRFPRLVTSPVVQTFRLFGGWNESEVIYGYTLDYLAMDINSGINGLSVRYSGFWNYLVNILPWLLCKPIENLVSPFIAHERATIVFFDHSLVRSYVIFSDESKSQEDMAEAKTSFSAEHDDEIVESDIELDNSDVVEPEEDAPQLMGDPTVEVTDENRDAAQSEKSKALDAISEGKFSEAIDHLTRAIVLNPTSAILYATRAGVFLKMKKPNAAIRDADAALQFKPDSAKGYKARGLARAMLGQWEEAAVDLHQASKLDYEEEIGSMLKKTTVQVEPNAKRIGEHRRKYERLRKQRELRKAGALKDVISVESGRELEGKMKERMVMVYFTAKWCGPCRYMGPVYTKMAAENPRVAFLKVDIDEATDVAASSPWNISAVPTFFLLKHGKLLDKFVGADPTTLQRMLSLHSSSSDDD